MSESYLPKAPLTHPANRRVKSTTFTPSGYTASLDVYEQGRLVGVSDPNIRLAEDSL